MGTTPALQGGGEDGNESSGEERRGEERSECRAARGSN
jgi:hypothetical protein